MLLHDHTPEVRAERAATALREAQAHRLAAQVRVPRQHLALRRTRRAVGAGLVRLGERLAGTEPQHELRHA